jgi:hypothetical protein
MLLLSSKEYGLVKKERTCWQQMLSKLDKKIYIFSTIIFVITEAKTQLRCDVC